MFSVPLVRVSVGVARAAGIPVAVALFLASSTGQGLAASPEYCAVYARASADPDGVAAASADDTETIQRAHDKAYFECLNLDDEPKLPAEIVDRVSEADGVGEGDISEADETPVIKKTVKTPTPRKTASAEKPRKTKTWSGSGYDAWTPEWTTWCRAHYKSFNPETGEYLSFEGDRKMCK